MEYVMWDDQFEQILRSYLPFLSAAEPLDADAALRDLGLDSLGKVELLGSLEAAYDIRFMDEALSVETFETPETLWTTLAGMLPANA
jgi:acyl carrier protein